MMIDHYAHVHFTSVYTTTKTSTDINIKSTYICINVMHVYFMMIQPKDLSLVHLPGPHHSPTGGLCWIGWPNPICQCLSLLCRIRLW